MAGEIKIVEEAKKQLSMNPKKFALWLFMVSVVMINTKIAAMDTNALRQNPTNPDRIIRLVAVHIY